MLILVNHVLICKFIGIWVPLPFLESLDHHIWNPKGEIEVILVANNYFLVVISCIIDKNKAFKEGHIFIIKLDFSLICGMLGLVLWRSFYQG